MPHSHSEVLAHRILHWGMACFKAKPKETLKETKGHGRKPEGNPRVASGEMPIWENHELKVHGNGFRLGKLCGKGHSGSHVWGGYEFGCDQAWRVMLIVPFLETTWSLHDP